MSNALNRDLKAMVAYCEGSRGSQADGAGDCWRLKHHLMPPVGWMNDPNGLCWHNGEYHVFYQYAPFNPDGGIKLWGHYKSRNLIDWEAVEPALYPDQPYDIHGVYSGSALSEEGRLYLFYTGNVKLAGDFNYIHEGREGNTVLAVSEDGIHFRDKTLLLHAGDYPKQLSCHIRDPKVWREGGDYYMVLGARTNEDQGEVLLYHSPDKYQWTLKNIISSQTPFGYMWECPDLFRLEGKTWLLVCPQGVKTDGLLYQNIYQSGYYQIEGDFKGDYTLGDFTELDGGYDFYAPQTFEAPDGRRILIGWMGMPDSEYTNPTTARGWQHALTFPRELFVKDDRICQKPVRELELLKKRLVRKDIETDGEYLLTEKEETFYMNLVIDKWNGSFEMIVKEGIALSYQEGIFTLKFIDDCGFGRSRRQMELKHLSSIEVLCDTSSLEVFLNGGERVMTTRYYGKQQPSRVLIRSDGLKAALSWWALDEEAAVNK